MRLHERMLNRRSSVIGHITRMMHYWLRSIIPPVFAVFCVCVTAWTGDGFAREVLQLRHSWIAPKAEATIIGFRDIRKGSARRRFVRTEFTYRYEFEGETYEVATQDLGPFADPDTGAAELKALFHNKQPAVCFVYADDPNRSYLDRPFSFGRFLLALVFTGAFAAVACIVIWHLAKSNIQRRRSYNE